MQQAIFGYTWEQIQSAQQKKEWRNLVTPKSDNLPILHPEDLPAYAKYGYLELKRKRFDGVIDRLFRAGVIDKDGNHIGGVKEL